MASTWKVTGQQETTESAPGTGFTRGYRVSFTTGDGNSGSVFVPLASYSADKVRAALAAAATTMDEVGALGGGSD